jgi:abnormal spindle-like microcephaly-associated protein
MAEVRKPTAAQRVIKVRNVRLALSAIERAGVDLDHLSANRGEEHENIAVKVDDIISGHCREVLALLWAVALISFARTLPLAQLQTEVKLLERKLTNKGLSACASGVHLQPGNDTPVTQLLFRWVRVVCGLYGVTVRNCSSSFTDGAAICLLVHHYVPSLVQWSSISIPPPVPRDVAEEVLGAEQCCARRH